MELELESREGKGTELKRLGLITLITGPGKSRDNTIAASRAANTLAYASAYLLSINHRFDLISMRLHISRT